MSIAALPLLPKKDARIVGVRVLRTTYDPSLLQRLSLMATRSSKKASLLEGKSGLTPARKTYPMRYKPERPRPAACSYDVYVYLPGTSTHCRYIPGTTIRDTRRSRSAGDLRRPLRSLRKKKYIKICKADRGP